MPATRWRRPSRRTGHPSRHSPSSSACTRCDRLCGRPTGRRSSRLGATNSSPTGSLRSSTPTCRSERGSRKHQQGPDRGPVHFSLRNCSRKTVLGKTATSRSNRSGSTPSPTPARGDDGARASALAHAAGFGPASATSILTRRKAFQPRPHRTVPNQNPAFASGRIALNFVTRKRLILNHAEHCTSYSGRHNFVARSDLRALRRLPDP